MLGKIGNLKALMKLKDMAQQGQPASHLVLSGLKYAMGPEAVSVLRHALQSQDPKMRLSATWALSGRFEICIRPLLQEALKNDDPKVRDNAVLILELFDRVGTVSSMQKYLYEENRTTRFYRSFMTNANALKMYELFKNAMNDERKNIRLRALYNLSWFGAARSLPLLKKSLSDKDQGVRVYAAHYLYLHGEADGYEFIERILDAGGEAVQQLSFWQPEIIAPLDHRMLVQLLNSYDVKRRLRTISTISLSGNKRTACRVLLAQLKIEKEEEILAQIIKTLEKDYAGNDEVEKVLQVYLSSAPRPLTKHEQRQRRDALHQLKNEKDEVIVGQIVTYLQKHYTEDEKVKKALQVHFAKESE